MAFDVASQLQRALAQTSEPSKRSVKNKSGRAGRKQYNGRAALRAVGGTAHPLGAIYDGNDRQDSAPEKCVVVERSINAVGKFGSPDYQVPQGQWLGRVGCV